MAEFPIVPNKTAMLFFDTLNVYLHPARTEAQAAINESGVIERLARLNRACRAAGVTIFYSQADHRPDGRDFAPLVVDRGHQGQPGEPPRLTAQAGAVSGTAGVEVIPELAPEASDYVIKKH